MTKKTKNVGLSIKMRLWNIAAENKRDKNDNQMYQLLAIRYIQERLLYLSCFQECSEMLRAEPAVVWEADAIPYSQERYRFFSHHANIGS